MRLADLEDDLYVAGVPEPPLSERPAFTVARRLKSLFVDCPVCGGGPPMRDRDPETGETVLCARCGGRGWIPAADAALKVGHPWLLGAWLFGEGT